MSLLILSTLLSALSIVSAQSVLADGCMRLLGSSACPAYSYAYIHPANLSNAFPWMSSVRDVASFDAAVFTYLSNPDQWQTTKFRNQLGCSNATGAYVRYSRTVLCSKWVNEQWSVNCDTYYNGTSAATSMKMVCQNTCLDYAASERDIVTNANYCPGPEPASGSRNYWLLKDYADCTNWFSLATNDSSTCISGAQNNEVNCGFASSTAQLCTYCSGSNPDSCCYASNTDVSVCGYTLPARPSSTSSAAPSSTSSTAPATSAAENAATSSRNLSGGQIAGIVVGSVIGGLLLLALLGLLIFCCCFRKRKSDPAANRNSGSSFAPSAAAGTAAGTGAGMFGLFGNGKDVNASEKGLLNRNSVANASSPTMGGDTLYGNANRSMSSGSPAGLGLGISGAGAGAGAAAGAFAGGATAGERTSGVVLPRVKDENQNGDRWIETGSDVTVLWPYQATLPDELDLRPGMKLRVLRLYDDAWGTAQVISGGEAGEIGKQGAFPIVCVSEGSSLGSSGASSSASH